MSRCDNLYGLCVKLVSTTASFRNPNAQLYHETLPLPSPSGLVGIAGAAMGLPFAETLSYFKENKILVGCKGKNIGTARDLWNYNKIKSKEVIKDIIMREFLYRMNLTLYYASNDKILIEKLYNSFINPVFSLTLGNSDDIAKIINVNMVENVTKKRSLSQLHETWIYQDCSQNYSFDWEEIRKIPVCKSIQPPIVRKLPTNYKFNKNGSREAIDYVDVTYLNPYTCINTDVEVYLFKNQVVSLYPYDI